MKLQSLRKELLLCLLGCLVAFPATAQRQMEPMGRGVVAIHSATTQAYVGWRLFANDPADIRFNVLRSTAGGVALQVNVLPITNTTDFLDTTANFAVSNAWFVQPVVGTVTQALSAPFGLAANTPVRQYIPLPLQSVIGGAYAPYDVKFCWVGDLDGDGEYDYVVDRISDTTANVNEYLQAYKRDGTFLWQIDMGYNSTNTSGNSTIIYEPGSSAISIGDKDNVTVYDMDGDGRAEVLLRTANGVVFGDGSTQTAGANDNVQFMSVIDGMTGAEITRAQVPNPYIADGPLNCHAGILYGDGVHPYVFLDGENRVGSGAFQRLAVAWQYQNRQLTQRWFRQAPSSGVNESRGHQIRVADVNHDGIDELIEIGSAYNGATGQPIYDTEIVHGDRYHVSDLDPDRPGLETYIIQQLNSTLLATALVDSQTGQLFKKWYSGGIVDVGRGDALDMDPRYRGVEVFSTQPGIFDCKGNQIPGATAPFPALGLWWDADNQREILGAADGNGYNPVINKWNATANNAGRLYSVYSEGVHTAFGGRPAMFGDLFGDWREEFVVVANDYSQLRIYTTKIAATNRLYCLMQNPAYRVQCTAKGYYQASYPDYYLGEQMQPPAPPTAIDSKLVWRGNAGNIWDPIALNWFTNALWISNNTAVAYSSGDSVLFDLTGSNAAAINLPNVLTPGDVTIHSPKDYTFSGAGSLSGTMKLTKVGKGKLTLSNSNDFTGATTVWEGPLVVNGSLLQSPVTVRGGTWLDGEIAGKGFVGAGVTIYRGGSVSPGFGENSAGTLTISNGLVEIDGAFNRFDLSDDASGTIRTNDVLNVIGNLTFTGTNNVVITLLNTNLPAGVYPLINYTGSFNGALNNLVLLGLDGIPAVLTNPPGQIALLVKNVRAPATLTWTGGLNGNLWDLASSSNWVNGASKDYFVSKDTVRFDNAGASNATVNLSGSLIASSVMVDSASNYVFSGSGAIIGQGSLTKSNTGMLTINTVNNTFTGRTLIAGGTLVVSELDAIGYPSPLGNPPGGSTNLILSGNSTLRVTGESYTDRGLTVNAGTNSIEVLNSADQVTVAGQIIGAGTLQKLGPGTLALTVSNAHSGTIIKNGSISLGSVAGNQYGVGSAVTLDGGRLSLIDIQASENCPWSIFVPTNSTGRIDCDGRSTLSGPLTGGGDLTVYIPYVRTDFSGNWSAFAGQIFVISDSGGGNFRCNNSAGYPKARMNLGSTISLQNRVGGTPTISIGELSGSAGANFSAPGGNDGVAVNWSIGALNTSATYAGNSYNGVGLIKVGTGTWTLTGTNIAHTGQTTVNGGTLMVHGNAAAATGAITVGASGTLGGNGVMGGAATVNGRISPGASIGVLTLTNNVILSGSSSTLIEIRKSLLTNDLLDVGGTLSYGGTLIVSNLSGSFTAGDSFKIFDAATYAGSFVSSNLPSLPANLSWDMSSLITNGTLRVITNNVVLGPQALTWKGDGAANRWDVGGTANWLTAGNGVSVFNNGDSVAFNDSGSNNVPVVLTGALQAASLIADASKDYTFAGSGSIAGTNSLVKSGSGMLTLTTTNSYTGPTIINAGTLRLLSLGAGLTHRWSFDNSLVDSVGGQNASIVEIGTNNATLNATNVTLAGGSRTTSDYVSLGSNLLPKSGSAATIELWATQNAIQNWSRIFDFGSSATENLLMSWSQGTTLTTDRVEWKDSTTSTVDNSNQPFTLGAEFHIAMVIEPGAGANGTTRVTWYRAASSGAILGAARGTFDSTNTLAAFNDANCWLGRSEYTGDNTASASYNEVRIWNRALSAADLQMLHSAGPDAAMNASLPNAATVSLAGAAAKLENASGQSLVLGGLSGVSGSEIKLTSGSLTLSNAGSATFDGILSGTNGLTKLGAGTLTLSGPSTFTGNTTLSNGTVLVKGSFGSSLVNVWGGTLGGSGSFSGPVFVRSGAMLSPGNSIGTLTISNTLSLFADSTTLIELSGSPLTNDVVKATSGVAFEGNLVVTNIGLAALTAGDRFQIFSAPVYSGSFAAITLPSLNGGLIWNTNRLATDGTLWVLSSTPPQFSVSMNGQTGFVLNGTGGTPAWDYYLLCATNLTLPVQNWTRVSTNQFDATGNFSISNAIDPTMTQQFFRIQVP
jgi:fibronectin-binding autotransporter adhesin